MIYREYLVMRKAVLVFLAITFALSLFAYGLSSSQGHPGTNASINDLFVIVGFTVAATFASIFGVALGNGSREPARVLWTFPESRLRSALAVIAVDFAGIIVALFGALFCFIVVVYLFALLGLADVHIRWLLEPWTVMREVTYCFAVYGWSAMISMLLRRVPYAGIAAFPICLIWSLVAQTNSSVGALARVTSIANPLVIVTWYRRASAEDLLSNYFSWLTVQDATMILVAITLCTCAVAVVLWQRAEAIS